MRFSILAVAASCIALASAADYSEYLTLWKPNGACVDKCNIDTGKKLYADYSEDPANPHFMDSMAYTYSRGTPKTTSYMSQAGMCMSPCPADQLDLYTQQYPAKLIWYNQKLAELEASQSATSASSKVVVSGAATAAALLSAVALL